MDSQDQTPGSGRAGFEERPKGAVRIAVFDFDGTLIGVQSGVQFTRYLFFHGLIRARTTAKIIWWGLRYKFHLPHEQDIVRSYIIDDLASRPREEVFEIMARFHDEVLVKHYRKQALEQIRRCHEEGCVCVLASATFWGIARAAAAYAGLDDFLATRMEAGPDGRFTGRVDGNVVEGPEKPRAVTHWANERYGEGAWTIEYAFGDHHSDEEMLSAAEKPFAVDPGTTMKRIAKRHGWPVLEWE